ncbi:hypothetical protein FACS1894147_02470 [Spirochaetia bacterium]|nr:hypothetical protein FACS1894147_02470 [Spirochaetia bacterium]
MSKNNGMGGAGLPENAPTFCAVEEHAKTLEVSAPVFAAVRQYKGWAAGKKVDKSDFEKAVKDFLGAPMGGKK